MAFAHLRSNSSKCHRVITIAEILANPELAETIAVQLCKIHGQPLMLFDLQCRQYLCVLCMLTHSGHRIYSLSEASPACHAELNQWDERLEIWKARANMSIDAVNRCMDAVELSHDEAAAKVNAAFDQVVLSTMSRNTSQFIRFLMIHLQVVAAVDSRRKALHMELGKAGLDKQAHLTEQRLRLQTVSEKANFLKARVQVAMWCGVHNCVESYNEVMPSLQPLDANLGPKTDAVRPLEAVLTSPVLTVHADVSEALSAVANIGREVAPEANRPISGAFRFKGLSVVPFVGLRSPAREHEF
jgi:hypothetical protein